MNKDIQQQLERINDKKIALEKQLDKLKQRKETIDDSWNRTGNKDLLVFFVEILPKVLDAERCSIFVHDPDTEKVWLQCGTGLAENQVQVPKGNSLVGEVISDGQFQIRQDMDKADGVHRKVDSETGYVTRNAICVPVKNLNDTQVVGAIQVLNKKNHAEFSTDDRIILEKLAYHLQFNIENIFLNQDLVRLSDKLKDKIDAVMEIVRN